MYFLTAAGSSGVRNAAERGDHLGEHRAVQRNAGDGKTRGGRRVRMNDRADVGSVAVDLEMHQQF